MYWWTSSSSERLNSFWVLLALLDPNLWGTVVSVRSEIFFPPIFFLNNHVENTHLGIRNVSMNRLAPPLSSSLWSRTRMPCTQQQAHFAKCQDMLLPGQTWFPPLTLTTHPSALSPEHQQLLLCFLQKVWSRRSLSTSVSFWQSAAGKEIFCFWTQPAS